MGPTLEPLFEAIVRPRPGAGVDLDGPTQMLVTTLSYDDYKGKIAIGRLHAARCGGPAGRQHDHGGDDTAAATSASSSLIPGPAARRGRARPRPAISWPWPASTTSASATRSPMPADPRPAADQGRGADRPDDLRRQHQPVRRPRGHLRHLRQIRERLYAASSSATSPCASRTPTRPTPSWSAGAASCTWRS